MMRQSIDRKDLKNAKTVKPNYAGKRRRDLRPRMSLDEKLSEKQHSDSLSGNKKEKSVSYIGGNLAEIRKVSLGFTQRDVSDVTGIPHVQIASLESGKSRWSVHQLKTVSAQLRISIENLAYDCEDEWVKTDDGDLKPLDEVFNIEVEDVEAPENTE